MQWMLPLLRGRGLRGELTLALATLVRVINKQKRVVFRIRIRRRHEGSLTGDRETTVPWA